MFAAYLRRGAIAGAVGGLAYGLFVAGVGQPLIRYAETFEHGGHEAAPVVPGPVAAATSVGAGVLWGLLLGVLAFGIAYYLLEPTLPGGADGRHYVLAAAGFVTVSGAPWLAIPPQPPGVEQSLGTAPRLAIYGATVVLGALVCAGSVLAYRTLRERSRSVALLGATAAFVPLGVVAALGPAVTASGPLPDGFVVAFRSVVAAGQVLLWLVLASTHDWLCRREATEQPVEPGTPRPAD